MVRRCQERSLGCTKLWREARLHSDQRGCNSLWTVQPELAGQIRRSLPKPELIGFQRTHSYESSDGGWCTARDLHRNGLLRSGCKLLSVKKTDNSTQHEEESACIVEAKWSIAADQTR